MEGLRILDLGCGKGRFARALWDRGSHVVGLDLSAAMLAEAAGVDRVRATARRLPLKARSFDGVIAVEMFEHLEDPLAGRGDPGSSARPAAGRIPGNRGQECRHRSPAHRPWLPSALVKRIDEHRGRWMYPAGGPVRERWFWPSRLKNELRRWFDNVRIIRLLSPVEERSWLFRRLPVLRLMTLWLAQCPGGSHV